MPPYELELYGGISFGSVSTERVCMGGFEQVRLTSIDLTPGCGVEFGRSGLVGTGSHQKSEDRDYTEPSRGLKIGRNSFLWRK